MNIYLITTIIGTLATFLGIYVVETPSQKLFTLLVAVLAIWLGYLTAEREAGGSFGRAGDWDGASGTAFISGAHRPKSIEFTIRLENSQSVVAEGLRLDEERRIDERMTRDGRIGLELLSVDSNGFLIRVINETGSWIDVAYLIRYSLLSDWIHKTKAMLQGMARASS